MKMSLSQLHSFLSGAIMIAAWAISLFFFRFKKATGDRLFGYFSLAFALLGIERLGIEFLPESIRSGIYVVRLIAFLFILFAIIDKNRADGAKR
jgi:hypothetical protein